MGRVWGNFFKNKEKILRSKKQEGKSLEDMYRKFQEIMISPTSDEDLQNMIYVSIDDTIRDMYITELEKRRKKYPERYI